jgi:protocatechuate 3,4-dioxygenase beta subunit
VDDHAALASRVVLSDEPSPKHPSISVSGMVIDPNGVALEGMSVVLRANMGGVQYASLGFPHSRDILARTTTDMRGRFSFTRIGIPPRMVGVIDNIREGKPGAQLLAWGRGYGLQWQSVQAFEEADKQFRLSEEADVSGVVVDELGHPMDDAQLVVTGFTQETGNLDAFLSGPGDLNLVRSEIQFRAAVRGGRFVLANMPRDYRISIRCKDFVAGHQVVFLIDTGKGTIREARYRNAGRESVSIHRTPIRITAKRQPSIRLRIVDHKGNPVSGGGVDAIDENRRPGGSTEVDEHGVAILAVNQPGMHDVYYSGDPLNPVSGLVHSIDFPPGQGETVVMKLPASRPIAGRVVDGDTGEPVSGVYVHARRQAEEQTTPRVTGAITVSGSDGRFQLPVTEGLYRFSIRHEVNGYFVPTLETRGGATPDPDFPRVTVTADQIPEEVVIRIGRGLMVEGTVLNPQGMPVSGVKVLAASDGPPYRQSSVSTDSDGRFQLAGHSPYVPTRITVLSDLGAAQQTIAAATDHPWDKTLRKTVTLKIAAGTTLVGRVVRNGRPVSGVRVRLLRAGPALPGEDRVRFDPWGEAVTDDQGRYQLSGLSKGDRYYLEIEPYENAEVRDWPYQMPYSHAVGVEDGATIELPDAELISHGQTLAGVVVDPDGNPVEGITVSASLASGGRLSRPRSGPTPWVQTDGEGRFRLTYLPDEPISLMAHRANPAGGRIRYPSRVNPEMNANDIHIVFDPTLLEEPEDLDSQD